MSDRDIPYPRLYADLLDFEHREERGRRYRFDAGLGNDTEHEDRNDLERRVLVSGGCKFTPAYIGHRWHRAGSRIVHGGVDAVDGALGVAVVECDEPFHLLARITDEAG